MLELQRMAQQALERAKALMKNKIDTVEIQIELKNDQISLIAGSTIQGKVHLNVMKQMYAKAVTITFQGFERVILQNNEQQHTTFHQIYKQEFEIHTFDSTLVEEGSFAFPFNMELPSWLPQSVYLSSEFSSIEITYQLQVDFAFSQETKDVLIYNQSSKCLRQNMQCLITKIVRSFFGTTSTSVIKVNFDRNIYQPGEQVQISVQCDNLQCKNAIKSFKVKLQRKWVGFTEKREQKKSEYLRVVKVENPCQANSFIDTMIEFQLPMFNLNWNDNSQIGNGLSNTVHGAKLSIQYFIRFFVKYDSIWEYGGEGHCICLPIRIQQPFVQAIGQPVQLQFFRKLVVAPGADLQIQPFDLEFAQYQREVILPNEQEWCSGCEPFEMTRAQVEQEAKDIDLSLFE